MEKLLKLSKKQLIDGLSIGGSLAKNNSLIPILENVKFEANDGTLTISSSDTENFVQSQIPTQNSENNIAFCVNGNDIKKIIPLLNEDDLTIKVNNDNIQIVYQNGITTLPTLPASNFVQSKQFNENIKFQVDSETINYIINQSKAFVSNDELSRPALACTMLSFQNNTIQYCATDSLKLIYEKIPKNYSYNTIDILIKQNNFYIIDKITSKKNSTTFIFQDDDNIGFQSESNFIIMNKPTFKFPNFNSVLSSALNTDKSFTINKQSLLNSIKRLSVCADKHKSAKISIQNNITNISTEDLDFAKQSSESIKTIGDNAITFGCALNILEDAINAVPDQDVILELNQPHSPIIFKSSNNPNLTILAMPLNINNNQ